MPDIAVNNRRGSQGAIRGMATNDGRTYDGGGGKFVVRPQAPTGESMLATRKGGAFLGEGGDGNCLQMVNQQDVITKTREPGLVGHWRTDGWKSEPMGLPASVQSQRGRQGSRRETARRLIQSGNQIEYIFACALGQA